MPASTISKLAGHFARLAAASAAAASAGAASAAQSGAQSFRSAASQTGGSSGSGFAQGLSGAGSSGAGLGGAKYHAGRGAHSHFQNSGRALVNANGSTAADGTSSWDEDEELQRRSSTALSHRRSSSIASRAASNSKRLRNPTLPQPASTTRAGLQRRFMDAFDGVRSQMLIAPAAALADDKSSEQSKQRRSSLAPAVTAVRGQMLILPTIREDASSSSPAMRTRSLSTSALRGAEIKLDADLHRDLPPHIPVEEVAQPIAAPEADVDIQSPPPNQQREPRSSPTQQSLKQGLLEARSSGATQRGARKITNVLPALKAAKREALTTEIYNLAMESLVVCLGWAEPDNACAHVRDLYVRMIERDCLPNATTFSFVVRAFCLADVPLERNMSYEVVRVHRSMSQQNGGRSISSKELRSVALMKNATAARFKQAMTLAQAAHNSAQPFPSAEAYQDLLFIAARFGDLASVKRIMEMLGSSQVSLDAYSYALYIEAISRDVEKQPGESRTQTDARKLKQCQEVLEQWRSATAEAEWNAKEAAYVYDALLRATLKLSDVVAGVGLFEQRLAVTATADEAQRIPPVGAETLAMLFYGFFAANEVQTALRWYTQLAALNAQAGESEAKRTLVVPPTVRSALARELCTSVKQDALRAMSAEEAVQEALPALQAANQVFADVLSTFTGKTSLNWRLLASLLERNAVMSALLAESQPDVAQQLLDDSLQSIKVAFELDGDELDGRANASLPTLFTADPTGKSLITAQLSVSLDEVMRALCAQARVVDAASVMTYALAVLPPAQPRYGNLGEEALLVYVELARELQTKLRATADVILHGQTLQDGESVSAEKLIAAPLTHLIAGAEYMIGALRVAGLQPDTLAPRIVELYRLTRATLQAEGKTSVALEGMSRRGWGNVVDAFMRQEELGPADFDALRESGLGMLLSDLAALPEEAQPSLHTRLPHLLAERYGPEGIEMLARSHAGLAEWATRAAWNSAKEAQAGVASPSASHASVTGYSASVMTQDANGVASTIDTPPYSPMYQAKRDEAEAIPVDEHLQLPPAYLDTATSPPHNLPAVLVIDTDFAAQMLHELRRTTAPGRFVPPTVTQAEAVWSQINAKLPAGSYPSLEPLNELLNTFGRAARLQRVHEVFAMGQHVIASLVNDAEWQASAWAELEDAMICALAHGGDTDAANVHRHRLIAGGGVPSVGAYAALIATVRDTTDDALVAQELFDESQRMGVRPNTFLYNAVISKLARARKGELAVRLFEEMRGPALQLRPSSITYGAVINACARTGDEENAERLFAVMEEDPSFRPRVPPYNTMMQFFAQTKPNREKVLKYYGKLRMAGIAPTEHTYKLLLDTYGLLEPVQLDEMKRVFGEIERDAKVNVQGVHWAAMITAIGAHDLQAASELFASIASAPSSKRVPRGSAPLPDAVCCEAILAVYVNHGRIDLMQEHLALMDQRQIGLTAYIANLVIRGYASQGAEGLEQARGIFEQMSDPPTGLAAQGNHPVGHRHHGAGSGSGEAPSVSAALNRAKNAPTQWQNVHREPSTWEAMVRAEVANQQMERAASLIQRMTERGYPAAVVLRARALIDEAAAAPAPALDA